jgi:hypothetical protein
MAADEVKKYLSFFFCSRKQVNIFGHLYQVRVINFILGVTGCGAIIYSVINYGNLILSQGRLQPTWSPFAL